MNISSKLGMGTTPTQTITFAGRHCVLKRSPRKPWAWGRSVLAALGCWLVFGERVAPAALRPASEEDSLRFEAQRLRTLRRAGRRVPQVLRQNASGIVMTSVGTSLDRIVPQLTAAEKISLFERVVDDLADWHHSGQWHGGAQLRNVTLHQHTLYRIDFEERHGLVLSAATTRVYDLLLFLGDALVRLDAGAVLPQGGRLMQRYLKQMKDGERVAIEQGLRCLVRVLQPLLWLDATCPLLTHRRDKQRVVRFARVVKAVLWPATAAKPAPAIRTAA